MDDVMVRLARLARELRLDRAPLDEAPQEAVRTLAAAVLEELVARGELEGAGPADVGCWARPRSPLS